MFKICTDTPVPNVEDLKKSFQDQLKLIMDQFPNFEDLMVELRKIKTEVLGILPTLIDGVYEAYSNILAEINEIIDGIKAAQDLLTYSALIQPLVSVIGGVIDDLVPEIPILGIKFTELLTMDATALYTAVKEALLNGLELPFIKLPLFEGFSSLAQEVVYAVKAIFTSYKTMLVTAVQDMIKQVLDILEIAAFLPTLFTIPTIEDIEKLLLALFPEYTSIVQMVKETGKSITELLAMLAIPTPNFGDVLINFYSNIALEVKERMNQVVDYISGLNLQMLVDFVKDTLGSLGFEFPTICFEF